MFEKILAIAGENHLAAVVEGSNMDDNGDYRPGLLAVAELGIKSPLRAAELDKEDIRALSKQMGLHLCPVKHSHKDSLDHIIIMMSQSNLVAAQFLCLVVEMPSAHTRAQITWQYTGQYQSLGGSPFSRG